MRALKALFFRAEGVLAGLMLEVEHQECRFCHGNTHGEICINTSLVAGFHYLCGDVLGSYCTSLQFFL